jgi:hypothetical protein
MQVKSLSWLGLLAGNGEKKMYLLLKTQEIGLGFCHIYHML